MINEQGYMDRIVSAYIQTRELTEQFSLGTRPEHEKLLSKAYDLVSELSSHTPYPLVSEAVDELLRVFSPIVNNGLKGSIPLNEGAEKFPSINSSLDFAFMYVNSLIDHKYNSNPNPAERRIREDEHLLIMADQSVSSIKPLTELANEVKRLYD